MRKELRMLATSLIRRVRLDLSSPIANNDPVLQFGEPSCDVDESAAQESVAPESRRWVALPRTLRLSTRPRPPINRDGSRPRIFNRISKSGTMPSFVFDLTTNVELLAERLVEEALLPLFRKLHPERSGWNLSLVNLCATNMSLSGGDGKNEPGRDIETMFNRQQDVLKEWRLDDIDVAPADHEEEQEQKPDPDQDKREVFQRPTSNHTLIGSRDGRRLTEENPNGKDIWEGSDETLHHGDICKICKAAMPRYAMLAHERFHALPD